MKKRLFVPLGLLLITLLLFATGCGITSPPTSTEIEKGGNQNIGIWVTGEGKATAVPGHSYAHPRRRSPAKHRCPGPGRRVHRDERHRQRAESGRRRRYGHPDPAVYITPVWTYNKDTGEQTLVGYRVDNTVTAKIRKVSDTGSIIDAVARAGGNYTTIQGISFTVDKPAPYQQTARQAAMADAQAKAKTLADAAKVNLGAPMYINETGGTAPIKAVPVPAAPGAPTPAPPPISPGETTITVDVQVVYNIK